MFATRKWTWPTVACVAAACLFAAASLLPVAEWAWGATTVGVSFEPSFDAEVARLLTNSGIVVRVSEGGERDTPTFTRGLMSANHPLRLDVLFDPQQAGETRLVATEALASGLGLQCLPEAIEPLIRRETAGGDRTYLASLGMEVVQAAYEADRFGKPVLPRWLIPGLAILCGALAWFSHRLSRMTAPVTLYEPSIVLTGDRRRLETKLARVEADIATTRVSLAERKAAVTDSTEPAWWERLDVIGRFRKRRDAARARVRTSVLAEKLESLAGFRTAVEAELSRNDRQLSNDQRRFDSKIEDRAWLTRVAGRVVGILAITAVVLAATHATVAVTYPGALLSSSRFNEMLFRGDTLVATALEANPDLAAAVDARCFARVVQPEPQEVAVVNAAGPPQGVWQIVGPLPPWSPVASVQHCQIGSPCGNACIPAGRVCHIGQMARVGQECGKGYISMAKTCRIDHAPPQVTPVVARPAESATPLSGASMSTYPRPDDAPRYVSPPSSADAGESGTASTLFRSAVPAPTRQATSPPPMVHVDGYKRSDGTAVQPYDRAAPGQGTGRGSRR